VNNFVKRRVRRLAIVLALGAPGAVAAKPNPTPTTELPSLAPLVDTLRPGVVNIQAIHAVPAGKHAASDTEPSRSLGSGFVVDEQGHVVTNAHVVAGATEVRVVLHDRRTMRATVVGRDTRSDVALLILVGAKDVPTVKIGDSDALRVGDQVIAIGNPFGLGNTVTAGIVSAKERQLGEGALDEMIQTDASINPGNSGGPLFNARGEVVGISTAVLESGQGIGFAVPMNTAKPVIHQLRKSGKVVRGWIGVGIQDVTPELAAVFRAPARGALVASIDPGSPAARAGLAVGDVIVSFDGRPIEASARLPRYVGETTPGRAAEMVVLREGAKRVLRVNVIRGDEEKPSARTAEPEKRTRGRDLGIEVAPSATKNGGVVISSVDPRGPASGSLSPGDVVLDVNRRAITTAAQLETAVKAHASGPLLLRVRRGGTTVFVPISL
jgi:serine protease Do